MAQIAAVLSIGAGVIHVSAAGDHTNLPVMFAGFMVVATLQVALGALLLSRRPSRLVVAAGVLLMISSVGVWVLSRTEGLPFLENGHTEPVGFKDGVTVLFELGSIPALLLLMSRDLSRVSLPSPRLGSQAIAALGIGCFALMVPALMLGGGEHHSHDQAVEMGIHTDSGEDAHADTTASHTQADDDHADGRDEDTPAKHPGNRADKHGHSDDSSTTTLASAHGHGGGTSSPQTHDGTDGGTHDEGGGHRDGDGGGRDHSGGKDHGKNHGRKRGDGKHDGDHGGGEGGEQPANPVQQVVADVVALVQPPDDPRR